MPKADHDRTTTARRATWSQLWRVLLAPPAGMGELMAAPASEAASVESRPIPELEGRKTAGLVPGGRQEGARTDVEADPSTL
jgi:hypothetical protein